MGYSVMTEKSPVFINGSLLLCLWMRICTQRFIVRLTVSTVKGGVLCVVALFDWKVLMSL